MQRRVYSKVIVPARRQRAFLHAGICVAAAAIAGPAAASDWTVTIGGRAQAVVPYEGAGHDVVLPVPSLQIRRPGDPDRPTFPGDAFGLGLVHFGKVSLGPAVRVRGPRNTDGAREGLDPISRAWEVGGFVTVWPTEWLRLHVDAERGIAGHSGWVADAAADLVVRPGRFTLTAGPRIGFGDSSYMNTYFGLSAAEALTNAAIREDGGGAYAPEGGRRYTGAVVTLSYNFSKRWQGTANGAYHRLSQTAIDSPVVRSLGEANEYSGGLGLRYSFGWTP